MISYSVMSLAAEEETSAAFSAEDLSAMTVARIKALAAERGYTITKTLKADIIAQFLEQQDGSESV